MATEAVQTDYLDLSSKEEINRLLEQFEDPGHFETIFFSDSLIKYNRRGHRQERILMITDRAIYNIKPGSYDCKRRVDISNVSAVAWSSISDQFIVKVPAEYDYRFESPRKLEIANLSRKSMGLPMRQFVVPESDLSCVEEYKLKKQFKADLKRGVRVRSASFVESGIFNAVGATEIPQGDEEEDANHRSSFASSISSTSRIMSKSLE